MHSRYNSGLCQGMSSALHKQYSRLIADYIVASAQKSIGKLLEIVFSIH